MSYKMDLHLHTNYSDGIMSPVEIVKRAKDMGYDMIAITDHDGIDGVREGIIAGEALNVKVIPGIEFSAYTEDDLYVHILGYYFDVDNVQLNEELKKLKEYRILRNNKLLKVLSDMGYEITPENLQKTQGRNYVGKPNIARALANKGYIKDVNEAFVEGKFLESTMAKAVKKEKISTSRVVKLIKDAGGIAVIAHPMKIKGLGERGTLEFFSNLFQLIGRLKKEGVSGIECYHINHTEQESLRLVEIAEKYHMHITEGSDFHGDMEK